MLDGPIEPNFVDVLNGMKALMFKSCWKADGVGNADTDGRLNVNPLAELFETTSPA